MLCLDDQFPVAEVEQLPVAVHEQLPVEVDEQRPVADFDLKDVLTVATAVSTTSGLEPEPKTVKPLKMADLANG